MKPASTSEPETRRQLSLFVPPTVATEIEAVRRALDPVQARLIPAHVTLCREDELGLLSAHDVEHRSASFRGAPVTLRFGRPEGFLGHGVLLHCIDGSEAFHALRQHVLGSTGIRLQRPHITLAHPRNPRAPGNSLSNAARLPEDLSISFPTIALIAQRGLTPWNVLREFQLAT